MIKLVKNFLKKEKLTRLEFLKVFILLAFMISSWAILLYCLDNYVIRLNREVIVFLFFPVLFAMPLYLIAAFKRSKDISMRWRWIVFIGWLIVNTFTGGLGNLFLLLFPSSIKQEPIMKLMRSEAEKETQAKLWS